MFGSLDISTSALVANRTRLDAISANLANVDVPVDPKSRDVPFSERVVYFETGDPVGGSELGVHVAQIAPRNDFRRAWEPWSKFADADGYVTYSNVNPVEEMVNMISASRSYQNSVEVMNTARSLLQKTLQMGQG